MLRLHALGPVRITSSDGVVITLTQPRRVALLSYLVLARPRGLHPRDTLLALLWPEADTAHARQALRNALHAIRKAVGVDVIITAGKDMVGVDFSRIDCDVFAFDSAGDATAPAGGAYELLSAFHVADAPEFERWLDGERASLHARVMRRTIVAADAAHARGDVAGALALAEQAQRMDGDDEAVLRRRLQWSADLGDLAGAMRSYHAHVARIAHEHDATPDAETAALAARLSAGHERNAQAHSVSIAVLPVLDATTGGDADDICAALGDGVIRRLSRIPGVRVCARGAVARYREPDRTTAARDLGVDIIVDTVLGTATGTADIEARIEVVRASDATLLREAVLRADPRNLFMLEGALTATITPLLGRAAGATAGEQPQPTRSGEAYVLYVRGTYLFMRAAHPGGNVHDLLQCREFFERAIALDPEFGLAYAGLANYYAVSAARNLLRPFREHFAHAVAICHRALAVDPALAIPHVHFGVQAMFLECDWEEAGQQFERAVALDPWYAEGRRFLGIYHAAMGDMDAALAQLREAVRLEPHMPMFRNSLADALMSVARFDEAAGELHAALQLDPSYKLARDRLLRCYERTARIQDALCQRELLDADTATFAAAFATHGVEGYLRQRRLELHATIETLEKRVRPEPPENAGDLFNPPLLQIALAYAELGNRDAVRACADRAAASNPGALQWFLGRPELAASMAGPLQFGPL